MPTPAERLRLGKATSDALGHQACDLLQDLEHDHRQTYPQIQANWDWYHAKPLAKNRMEPWPNASNAIIPIIKIFSDAITARIWGRMHTETKTWEMRSGNEDESLQRLAGEAESFQNRESRSTFDILTPTYDWANECTVQGSSVLGVGWGQDISHRWKPGGKKPVRVITGEGPRVRHIPKESCLWEIDRTIQESTIFALTSLLTWNDLALMVQTDGWDRDAVEFARGHAGIDGPQGQVLAAARERAGEAHQSSYQDPHDIREIWLEWPMAQLLSRHTGGIQAPEFDTNLDEQVPVVLTVHKRTKKILRAVAHPYFFARWPFLDIYFRKDPGRANSMGAAQILEHIQRGISVMVNQSVDAVTMSNSLKVATSDPRLKNLQWRPNQPLYTEDLQNLLFPNLGAQVIPDIQLVNLLLAMGERVMGIADVNFGRETRLGGHPAPATNTLTQLQEGAKVLNGTLRSVRQQLSEGGNWILALYQQHGLGEESRLRAKLGEKDAALLQDLLLGPDTIRFDVHAMSEATNPDVERNAMVLVDQVTSNYYAFVLRMIGMTGDPKLAQIPGFQEAISKAIQDKSRMLTRILETTSIDDPEAFGLALQGSRIDSAQQLNEFGDFAQGQLGAGAQGAVPNGGLATAEAAGGLPAPGVDVPAGSGLVL